MTRYVYIDMSNLYIEGAKHSAIEKGLATDLRDAKERNITDPDFRIDFQALGDLLQRSDEDRIDASIKLFSSATETNEVMWRHARMAGMHPHVLGCGYAGKEKGVDVYLAMVILRSTVD